MNSQSDVLPAALAYAAHGWPVFPCNHIDKKPLTRHSFKDASVDPDQIRAWWKHYPEAMIGVPTGASTGIVILDVDQNIGKGKHGEASLKLLIGAIWATTRNRNSIDTRGREALLFPAPWRKGSYLCF